MTILFAECMKTYESITRYFTHKGDTAFTQKDFEEHYF